GSATGRRAMRFRACFCTPAGGNFVSDFEHDAHTGRWKPMKHAFVKALALTVAALVASATTAGAQQNYPVRPIHFIATELVGSATDIQARIIAKGMAEELGKPIEIENLFGEAGVEKGIKSAPDGYTIVYGGAGTLALLPHIKKVSYDGLKDLTPVGRFVVSP